MSDNLLHGLEEFTCRMYSNKKKRIVKVNDLRWDMIKSKTEGKVSIRKNIDLAKLPPAKVCLEQHIRRVNYQVGIWKRADILCPLIPNPWEGHGWTRQGEMVVPMWYEGDTLPQQLINELANIKEVDDDDYDDSDIDVDVEAEAESSSEWGSSDDELYM